MLTALKEHDVIVLGLGGMGSAALYRLAKRGARVLGLEQHGVAHDRGSSHGETRIIRKAYFEHPDYVPLLERAYAAWDALEREHGEPLFVRAGLLLCGMPGSAIIDGVLLAHDRYGVPVERWDARTIVERCPMLHVPPDRVALFERDAGYLHVERCVRAHLEGAQRAGAQMITGTRVRSWRASSDGVEVVTDDATHRARSLVITGGAWSSELLASLGMPLRVRRRVQLWLRATDARWDDAPVFGFAEPEGFFYGFPRLDGQSLKVAEHGGGDEDVDPDALDRPLRQSDIDRVARVASERLSLRPEVVKHATCMYTMSPDEHFVIGLHRDHPNVAFATGLSGHGFKFASTVGDVLADLAQHGKTDAPIALFDPARAALRERA